jgi:hypothetical protein
MLEANSPIEPPRIIWMTHEAGRLPGLGSALYRNVGEQTSVGVLRPEAVAVAVANLGERWPASGEMHLDRFVPLAIRLPENKAKITAKKTLR